ncbi:MAG: hypothetical protein CMK00_01495 [Planctomycetes bacterium]|jgi:TM2 domain-containing membrane protein YozV|nr:hypothetical protein [Planctomycetota bacterium]
MGPYTSKATSTRDTGAGVPLVALVLTWFIPGSGHLYLRRTGQALVAFILVEGLFFLGLALSDGMLLEYLYPELRGTFAAALTPEAGNLGGLLWQVRNYGYGPGFPRSWPPHMELGVLLTAASGVLNLILMCQVHTLASGGQGDGEANPSRWVLLTWLCPGLGHWLQGRRGRGLTIFLALGGLFLLSTILADGTNLVRERHFYYWSGQFLLGGPVLLVELIWERVAVSGPVVYEDAGLVIGCVAGMLNVLAMLDAYAPAESETAPATSASSVGSGVR